MPLLTNDLYGDDDSEEDLCVDQAGDDEDDDILLLSIQKKFGAFKPVEQPLPLPCFEEEDDEEILRAVQERFSSTTTRVDSTPDKVHKVVGRGANYKALCSPEQNATKKVSVEELPASEISSDFSPNRDVSLSPANNPEPTGFTFPGQVEVFNDAIESLSDEPVDGVVYDDDLLEDLLDDHHGQSIRSTLDALKKNRLCQRVLTSKLELVRLKLEENKDLKKRVSALLDFQSVAKRKYAFEEENGSNLAIDVFGDEGTKGRQRSIWPRIPSEGAKWGRGGPAENADVAKFRAMQKKYSLRFEPKPWTKEEKNELVKGVEQQVQESRIRSVMDMYRDGSDDATFLDDQVKAIAENPPTSEDIRAALPIINWNEVARLYVLSRSPTECWIQWSNYEDRLIDHGPWTKTEDKHLWSIAKQHKLCNWDRICEALGSRRSIAQCLMRYQRSLNVGIMRGAWTREEDEQLRAAVQVYGDQDWLSVSATLEGRTGPQCWNRWHKILNPIRQKSGRWNLEEDKRLKLAVSVYGPKMWKIIATHVPGRTEVQCRERWCNILDPSLISAEWTVEEDQRLEAAIAKHGLHRWSTVAVELSPRTDNQCWRRWKHLHPDLLRAFQKDNKIQKAALVNNFVGRKKERSELLPSDFVPKPGAFDMDKEGASKFGESSDVENCQKGVKRKRVSEKGLTKKRKTKESQVDGVGEPPTNVDCIDVGNCQKGVKRKRTSRRGLTRTTTMKESRVDGIGEPPVVDVTPEFSKMRRLERLEKIRQARAAGKLHVWRRPILLGTDLGAEKQNEPGKQNVKRCNRKDGSNPSKNGTTAFVKLLHELASFCEKTELKGSKSSDAIDPSKFSGGRSEEDQGGNLSSSSAGSGAIETDEEVEAAVKAVLSWPFIWGLQDFWAKVHQGL